MNKNYFGLIIRGVDYNIGFNVRALLMYEAMTNGQSFNPNNLKDYYFPNNLEDLCKLFYCCVVTSERASELLDITYEEFIDELGTSFDYYVLLTDFASFLNDIKRLDGKFLSGGESQEEEANEE